MCLKKKLISFLLHSSFSSNVQHIYRIQYTVIVLLIVIFYVCVIIHILLPIKHKCHLFLYYEIIMHNNTCMFQIRHLIHLMLVRLGAAPSSSWLLWSNIYVIYLIICQYVTVLL